MRLEDVLVTKGCLSRDAARSTARASDESGIPLENLLLTSGTISEEDLKHALALSGDELEELKDRLLYLKRTPLFDQMDDRMLEWLAGTLSWEWFPRNQVIVRQGSRAADFYLVHSGRVRVSVSEGERERTLTSLSRGECFGEMSLVSGSLTTATVTAAEPTLCLKQGRKKFIEMTNRDPAFQNCLSTLIVKRIRTIYKDLLLGDYPSVQLAPPTPESGQETHGKPLIILTLGTFSVVREGTPIVFKGKAQKKPLLLLKALISLGGKQVRTSTVADLLWPDSEGDAASSAFFTTLLRLRRLLDNQGAVGISEGQARINPDLVWIDLWEFDRLCREADRPATERASGGSALDLMQRAIGLYKGHFLPAEEQVWTVSVRETLRSRFIKLVSKLGDLLERQGESNNALECYEKALEIDDLAEEFYLRLMTCHLKQGNRAEAIAVYERCARVLHAEFGTNPRQEILEIVRKIRGNGQ
jgi:two-component SAPR family response regulator